MDQPHSYIIAIDNGLNGAIACLDEITEKAWALPAPKIKAGKRNRLDERAMIEILRPLAGDHKRADNRYYPNTRAIFIERVQLVPIRRKDGSKSASAFSRLSLGRSDGAWRTAIAALFPPTIPLREVPFQTWQAALFRNLGHRRCGRGHDRSKQKARLLAEQLFPHTDLHRNRNGIAHDGVCDALLIAYWGKNHL
jgi:hypothetical protein